MNKKLLIIGFVWPEPNSSAAGTRMMQLIEAFKSRDYHIIFASTASKTEHVADLDGLVDDCKDIQLNHSSFDEFIKTLDPDIVVFDRFMTEEQFGWRVSEQCPNALRILDTEDLHSLRRVRQECYKANEDFTLNKWIAADTTKRELASIYRSDLTLIISEYEKTLLVDQIGIDPSLILYLPFMLEPITDDEKEALPNHDQREHFMTIGNFRHEPNYDSVLYLKDAIWPLIRKELPDAEMMVYGSYPMEKVTQLNDETNGFLIRGWSENADAVLQQARVCLAPLRFGAGLKGKFVDAMQNGTPSVTTSIGAEGLEEGFGGCIEDDPEELAKNAIALYNDPVLWKEKQAQGFHLVKKQFNKQNLVEQLLERIEDSLKNLESLRSKNVVGTILQHQSLQSTKYLSKWIVAKNQIS